MNNLLPEHMEITPSLLAGHRLLDGSLIEVDSSGDYRITDQHGRVLAETVDTSPGSGVHFGGGREPEDYGEILDSLASFLGHDAEIFEFSEEGSWGKHYPASADELDTSELIFNVEVARWADEHDDEISILACYMEDLRLEEENE